MTTDTFDDATLARDIGETRAHGIDAGIALALKADDSGDWKAVADWLARNAQHAAELADFLAAQRGLVSAAARMRPTTERVGETVGEFELRGKLGNGSFGEVYRAFDVKLEREVAVKVLRDGEAFSATELARFRYEAQVVASLQHANVVPILTFGETDSGPYLVMPLMTGGSLAAWLKSLGSDRQLAPKKAAEIVRQVALGVHHAHQRELIHRDLKPGNILLDETGVPHVADFGLARRVDASASTAAGIAGTVAYMAPEQGRGEKHLTAAADIYALGVILFELLTGGVPYGGTDAAGILLRLTDAGEPVPSVRRFRSDVPADLAVICDRCLEKRPEDRYATAKELADDLARFIAGEPVRHSRRRWISDVGRAVGWRRDTPSMGSWWAPLLGAASKFVTLGVAQVAVLADAPAWTAEVAVGAYLISWAAIIWLIQVVGWKRLNPVERASVAIQYGMMIACAALIPGQLFLAGHGIAACFQSFAVVIGLGIFVHGAVYWGGMYLGGLTYFAIAVGMIWVPVRFWPGVYGVVGCIFQVWTGIHLWQVHTRAVAAAASVLDSQTK